MPGHRNLRLRTAAAALLAAGVQAESQLQGCFSLGDNWEDYNLPESNTNGKDICQQICAAKGYSYFGMSFQ